MNKRIGLLAALCLAGCANQHAMWRKPGASAPDLHAALHACSKIAAASHPVDLEQVQLAPGENQASSGNTQPPTRMLDQNKKPRDQAIAACMTQGGWQPSGS